MTVAVSDIITLVKDYNPELTSADDARIIRWINSERLFLLNWRGSRVESDLTLVQAQDDLTADQDLVALPGDFVAMPDGGVQILNDDSLYVPAEKRERSDFREWDAAEKTYDANEYYYALRHRHLVLRPTPSANTTNGIQLDYYCLEADWASGGDIDAEFERFKEVLAAGAALRSGIRYEDGRSELERHYDNRLFPQFLQNFGQRDLTPARMKSWRSQFAQATGGRFGRVG